MQKLKLLGLGIGLIVCFFAFQAILTKSAVQNKNADSGIMKENQKIKLSDKGYFIYRFDKKPKMGTVVLKIKVFNLEDKKNLKIIGNYGMPSMAGAHDSGDIYFILNKKGDYLLPIDIVMPGEWKVNIKINNNTKTLFSGAININI